MELHMGRLYNTGAIGVVGEKATLLDASGTDNPSNMTVR
jgi:hypothetical protein